jgi:glycosyltransferase involved in cell wall biosynthesis
MFDMRLSIVMLTYNEAEFLPISLPPLLENSNEIVVLDMGSTDGTLDILIDNLRAEDLIVKYDRKNLFQFGFSHPRNYAAKYTSGDLVLVIDADELLEGTLDATARALLASDVNVFSVTRRNYAADSTLNLSNITGILSKANYTTENHRRLHRRLPQVRFEGLVHEELWEGSQNAFETAAEVPLVLHHLSAFRTREDNQTKHWLYAYLLIKAQTFPGFRFGTNDWFFENYVPENIEILLAQANAFSDMYGLPRRDKENFFPG